ncbi:DUF2960 domain-containing protein [Psychromonas sp. Urea-02u-13]|uniref:DUF2960 domain-containing protein n=1 Tax=Psychromonas sp. Urea-02u-13 TaxID=2058326 RepID=UPI000C31F143|nr:DUF2960 domain-containing protein [Psychromonas sp. Urea-02u-13]PKG39290.1 DUF2960 domain-containing protein [Psychromonas sp. Urea-02u-13]
MARQVTYKFKKKLKTIQFSYGIFHDIYEAVADAEGVDLTNFLEMEKQLAMSCRGQGILKNHRQTEFAAMGFSDIKFVRDEEKDAKK